MKGIFIFGLCVSSYHFVYAQQVQDSLKSKEIEAINFTKRLPVSKTIINVEKDLGKRNLGQDLPILLNNQLSLVTTSDAGNGVGYTGMRIRGVDGSRINVMLNGVPYNDSESQGTFFVNMADLTSSASNIIIQRGVGTSTNGVSAFGASVNVLTKNPSETSYFATQNSIGSFGTFKNAFEAGTGALLDGTLSFMGRYSIIKSDGYIDRAFSDLNSYHFVGLFQKNNTKIRFLTFGGKEKTAQAWNGLNKKKLAENRRYNPAGEIYNSDWSKVIDFYGNETDNYRQNHYHLLWEQRFGNRTKLSTTLHYTDGKGYYENYKQSERLSKYNMPNIVIGNKTIEKTDLIRRKWLDNDFYGIVSELNTKLDNAILDFGVVANQYYGRHYGQVYRATHLHQVADIHEYYRNNGIKDELAGYAKAIWTLGDLELFGDLQLRKINYRVHTLHGTAREQIAFNNDYTFFNPKAGVSYNVPQGKLYFSYAQANREPKRSDIVESNNKVKQEQLHDFELGFQKKLGIFNVEANLYYMLYKNQLVLNGRLNDVGSALHENVDSSYRLGMEVSAMAKFSPMFNVATNFTWSTNKIKNYQYYDVFAKKLNDLGTTNIAMSPNFIGNLSLNFIPVEKLELSLINKYVGKQYLDNTNNEDRKLDAYFVSDIIAGYNIPLKKTQLGFQLMVNNIFNKKYESNGYVYNDPKWVKEETPYFFPQAGTHFMLGISLRFE